MNINIEKKAELMVMSLGGRMDANTAPEVEAAIENNIEGIKDIVMDMTDLAYISSAGLRVLLSTQKKMNKIGTLKLKGVNEDVMEVFEMTGFADILDIED